MKCMICVCFTCISSSVRLLKSVEVPPKFLFQNLLKTCWRWVRVPGCERWESRRVPIVHSKPAITPTSHNWFYGVMVSTQDSESCDPSSNLGRTLFFIFFFPFSPSTHACYGLLLLLLVCVPWVFLLYLSLHYTILLLAGSHIAQLPGTIRESYNMYDNNMYDSLYMYMIHFVLCTVVLKFRPNFGMGQTRLAHKN